jgi:hypothetical protein
MKKVFYKLIYLILLTGIVVMVLSFSKPKESSTETPQTTGTIFKIPLDKNINNKGVIGFKEMDAEIQYIKLEFTPQCPLGRIGYLVATQDFFFVNSRVGIFQFSREGKFIRKIGNVGKGPGEYLGFRDFTVDETGRKLYVLTNWTSEILIYGFDGKYLGKIPLRGDSKEKCDYVGSSMIALQVYPLERKSLLSTELIDEQGNSIMKGNSSVIKLSEIGKWMGSNLVYSYNQNVYVKEFYNDTVFHISPKGLKPYFILELGKYASPFTYSKEERKKYIQPYRIFENDQRMIIFFFYDEKKCVAQYNKETGLTNVSIPQNEQQQGITNDIDNGMNYYMTAVPLGLKTTQNEWLLPIEAITLKQYCENKEVRGNLKGIISNLKVDDNPVIMVVKFK